MIRFVRWTFIVVCAVLATATTAWFLHMWIAGAPSEVWLGFTWTERFDERGGSGFRWHDLRLQISRNVMLLHSADWRPLQQSMEFDGGFSAAGPGETGFIWRSNPHPSGLDWRVMIPTWTLLLLSIVPVAGWLDWRRARLARARRREAGLCVACGYDLRASKDRCPECGRPISFA